MEYSNFITEVMAGWYRGHPKHQEAYSGIYHSLARSFGPDEAIGRLADILKTDIRREREALDLATDDMIGTLLLAAWCDLDYFELAISIASGTQSRGAVEQEKRLRRVK